MDLGASGEGGVVQPACSDIRVISETMCVQLQRPRRSLRPGVCLKLSGAQAGSLCFSKYGGRYCAFGIVLGICGHF